MNEIKINRKNVIVLSLIIKIIKLFNISIQTLDSVIRVDAHEKVEDNGQFEDIFFKIDITWDEERYAVTNIEALAGRRRVQRIGSQHFLNGNPIETF